MAPGLAVALNGTELVTVSAEGLNILNVRVHGDRISPDFANLEVSGGRYGESEEQKHLIWESERVISPGDEIAVTLLENASTSAPGKTIDDLYPEDKEPHGPRQPVEAVFHDLAQQPTVREGFAFSITPPSGSRIRAETQPDDHSFGFSVTWVWLHPDRARVSLSSNTLVGIFKREGGSDHAEFRLHYGQRVNFRVDG
jgi:hypothetical protein